MYHHIAICIYIYIERERDIHICATHVRLRQVQPHQRGAALQASVQLRVVLTQCYSYH